MSDITRKRGDTKPIVFQLWEDKDNDIPLDVTGYSFVLTVDTSSAPYDEATHVFSLIGTIVGDPSLGKVMMEPSAIDTDLEPATYYYDFEITDSDGYINTPILAKFKINQDITK